MKRALFIDRDGTIIVEPEVGQQVDSLEKLEFIPSAISSLSRIRQALDLEFVLVTNQDGLGSKSFPEETFWPAHNKMLRTLRGEGVSFDEIIIDRSFAHENAPTRKPGTALLGRYMNGGYDLSRSYVIGDRLTDIQLAENLGAQAIHFSHAAQSKGAVLATNNWQKIVDYLMLEARSVVVNRKTRETDIEVRLNLDGTGQKEIKTGLGFFDHMLDQVAQHSSCDLSIRVNGDLHVDEHHTIEDTALALGEAYAKALGKCTGIERYGFMLPMDDALAHVAIDFSGRPWLVWQTEFKREKIGEMPTEMFSHFFKSFCDGARCNLNIRADGDNEHHKIEAIFKGFARAIRAAIRRDSVKMILPSTKGVL